MLDPGNIDDMVLITAKERRKGYAAPLGTIYFTYNGEQRSIWPTEPHYEFIKTRYEQWKQEQADQVRRQHDQEQLTNIRTYMEETRLHHGRLTIDLPEEPAAKASIDDLSVPLKPRYQAEALSGDVTARVTLEPYPRRYGCYRLHSFYDKVHPTGALGRRQETHARELRDRLVAFFEARLHEAGWRLAHDEPGKWRWEGQSAVDLEQHIQRLVSKTWRGRHRDGGEKFTSLPDDSPLLSSAYASWQPVPEHAHLDYRVDLDAQHLRVRRHHAVPRKQEQRRTQVRRKLAVIGDQHARERGAAPAYYRTIEPRQVTFRCHICKQTVTQQLLPGPTTLGPHISGMLEAAEEQYTNLQQARPKPYILDDFTVNRVIQVFGKQKKDLPLFDEQLRRWRSGLLTENERLELERLAAQMTRLHEVIDAILTLAEELKQGTIEQMMSKSDEQLGLEALLRMMEGKGRR